jgi:hypothetical protein
MSEFPLGYERVPPTTWAYLSSLLMLALYFKFTRFWSIRNLDLLLIILLAPGLLMVHQGASNRQTVFDEMNIAQEQGRWNPEQFRELNQQSENAGEAGVVALTDGEAKVRTEEETGSISAGERPETELEPLLNPTELLALQTSLLTNWEARYQQSRKLEYSGYLFLFLVGGILLVRMLLDSLMVRRPLLEPNLSSGGLTFMGTAMLVFLFANIWMSEPVQKDLYQIGEQEEDQVWWEFGHQPVSLMVGPGYHPLYWAPILPTFVDTNREGLGSETEVSVERERMTKVIVILSLLAIALGIVTIGSLHFDNFWMGIGIATFFLMLPYTVQMMGRVSHVFPAALLVWALVAYRLPFFSGTLLGLATGVAFHPLFLLPLWMSFYWKRGVYRFTIGFLISIAILIFLLAYTSEDSSEFWGHLRKMFGFMLPRYHGLQGIWAAGWEPVFRLPLIAGSVALSGALVLWAARKNLGVLLSCSCAVMLATQFWHSNGGGLVMAWYLPLALLAIFRPNLEDRIALNTVRESKILERSRPKVTAEAI